MGDYLRTYLEAGLSDIFIIETDEWEEKSGYLQRLHAEREIKLPIATKMTERSTWEVAFEFESLGGRKYRTTLLLEAQVLSNFKFEQISEPRRVISTDKPPDQTV